VSHADVNMKPAQTEV